MCITFTQDCVIPITMETFRPNLNLCKIFIRDFSPGFIFFRAQSCLDTQAVSGFRAADEIDNDLMADKRPPAPILSDERKQTMLNLIPFACSRWKMTNGHIQGG